MLSVGDAKEIEVRKLFRAYLAQDRGKKEGRVQEIWTWEGINHSPLVVCHAVYHTLNLFLVRTVNLARNVCGLECIALCPALCKTCGTVSKLEKGGPESKRGKRAQINGEIDINYSENPACTYHGA